MRSSPPSIWVNPLRPIGETVRRVGEAFERWGDVIRVKGFPIAVYCFRNPDDVQEIFKHPDTSQAKCPLALLRVKSVMGNGAYVQPGDAVWRERRLPVKDAFDEEHRRLYHQRFLSLAREWVDQNLSPDAAGRDIGSSLGRLIARSSLGMFLSHDPGEPILNRLLNATQFIEHNFVRPMPLWVPTPTNLRFRRARRDLNELLGELVHRRRTGKAQPDLLSHLLKVHSSQTGEPWTDQDVVDEFFSIYFGASVMAITLTWGLYLLSTRTDIQERVRMELQEAMGGREPGEEDLARLPVLNAVFQEIVRLYPPSWGYPRCNRAGMRINEWEIPGHSLVVPMMYHVQRNGAWWESPSAFLPERFLRKAPIHPYAYLPFGAGPRMCLGTRLAPVLIKSLIAMILARCRIEAPTGIDPEPVFAFEIYPRHPIPLAFRRMPERVQSPPVSNR